jgi:hypothetical protein
MMAIPDYSPATLQLNLHARIKHAGAEAALFEPTNRISGEKAEERRICKAADISVEDFELALNGKAKSSALRVRLFAALKIYPDKFGVVLDDKGGQTPDNPKPEGSR